MNTKKIKSLKAGETATFKNVRFGKSADGYDYQIYREDGSIAWSNQSWVFLKEILMDKELLVTIMDFAKAVGIAHKVWFDKNQKP